MATTSIWRIKGWLGSVVIYIENPEKTDNPKIYEKQGMTDAQAQSLMDVIEYAADGQKTEGSAREGGITVRRFVSGVNCYPGTAREEMMATKLSKLLNISNEQMSYVTNADAGCGLIRYGSALVPFVNRFPKDTKLYDLMTTRPGEGVFGGNENA